MTDIVLQGVDWHLAHPEGTEHNNFSFPPSSSPGYQWHPSLVSLVSLPNGKFFWQSLLSLSCYRAV